jgi:hypothetical protein
MYALVAVLYVSCSVQWWGITKLCLVFCVGIDSCSILYVDDFDAMVFHRPVLKHGPRSLTYMRVFGCFKP